MNVNPVALYQPAYPLALAGTVRDDMVPANVPKVLSNDTNKRNAKQEEKEKEKHRKLEEQKLGEAEEKSLAKAKKRR